MIYNLTICNNFTLPDSGTNIFKKVLPWLLLFYDIVLIENHKLQIIKLEKR